MKIKNAWPLFLILFLIIASGLGYLYVKLNGSNNSLIIKVKSIKEQTKLYKINAEYPLFEQAPESFNNEIESQIKTEITQFKKNAQDNWNTRQSNLGKDEKPQEFPSEFWPFTLNWNSQQLNTHYISIVINSSYFDGGANETQKIITYNYDLFNKKELTLAEVMNEKDYLNIASDYCRKDLLDQFKDNTYIVDEFLNEGTAPKIENFKDFTFDDNTITFYFPKYQVAPGSYGEQKVVMPRNLPK